jgi:RNA polymerase sigma-70 factor (ECF subfamily)
MTADNDANLVARSLQGDQTAFEALVRKHRQPVYNLALRIVAEPEDAEEIAHSVFVKAYQKLDTYDPAYKFFSWIYRIALNESLSYAKRRSNLDEYESGISAVEEFTPEANLEEGELIHKIGDAVSRLKTDYRMVVVLRHYHDFSYQEMSEVLQIPEKTVKSRLFTARQQLKEILEKDQKRD